MKIKNPPDNLQFLSGGGEMGELIRAKDWSKTPIGKPENWPQSLRTMVSVMLDNPFGMYIAWGPEYTQLYNDGYRPILGSAKHPQALGISTLETFAEIWHIIESMFDGVMKGKAVGFPDFMLPLNRNGFVEECYFDFSYSPIRKEDGEVGGVLVTVIETTSKKKAEEDLKKSEERFRMMADNIPNLAWMADADGWIYWYNKKWYEYTGSTPEQMEGWGWQSVHDADELPRVLENWKGSIATGKEFEMVFPLKGADGRFRQFLTRVLPVKDGDGKIQQWFGANTDITRQKETEAALQESKDQLEFAIEATELGTWEYDPLTDKFSSNERVKKWFGLGADEHIELTHAINALHENDRQRVSEAIQKALDYSSGGNYDIEYTIVHPLSKKEMIVRAKGKAWYNDKKIACRFNGTLEDITLQTTARKKIEESEQRYHNLIYSSPSAIGILYGEDLIITIANEPIIEIWGKGKEIMGKPYFEALPELAEQGYKNVFAEVFKTGVPFNSIETPVHLLQNGIMQLKYYNFLLYAQRKINGEIEGIGIIATEVTTQALLNKQIQESEKRFRLLADSMPQHIWTSDPGGNLNYYNQSVFDYAGLTLEQINKEGWIQIVHPDDREGNIQQWLNAISTGNDFLFEHRFRRHDGEYRWQLSRAIPQKDENGKIQMWVGTSTDINEQKKALEQFKVLADQAPMWVWLTDKEVNILYTNPEVLKFLGIAHYTDFTGNMWEQKVHPEEIAMVYKTFGEAASLQQSFSFEFRVQNAKTRQYEWFYIKAVPRLENGEFTGFIGTGININEQKTFAQELEEKVIARTADLKASEEKFYTLFNLSPICKTLSDTSSGKIVMVNDAFTKLFGYSREETVGLSSDELGLLDLEARQIMINELQANGRIENREIWFIKKSGERFIALASSEVISMGDKQFFLSAFNDISEIKEAEQNIKQKNIELEKMNKELQSFAYISSHDLQEPLRKIQTFATRISEKEVNNLSDKGKEMFNRMQNAAERMQTLIQDLLAYSRTNTTELRFETTDLNEIIAEVKEDLKEEMKEKHATIEANQLCDADIIPFQFRQLMHNLIGNSLKFSNPENPPHIQIKSEIAKGIKFNNEKLSPQNKYCHITVSDNGIGFEQQYSEKIFEVFQRLHGKKEYNGTGIGLSIVKKIVENHHGIITANGELNKGATFEIFLPANAS